MTGPVTAGAIDTGAIDTGAVYAAQRPRITALVRDLTEEQAQLPVPGCPDWTVRELLSHLVGLPADLAQGRVEGAGTDPWTAAQVRERQGRPVAALLEEWERVAPALERDATGWGRSAVRIAYDVSLHADDLREALGMPLGDSPEDALVLAALVERARDRITGAGLPALELRSGAVRELLGKGPPACVLSAPSPAELSRALAGRRPASALQAMVVAGDLAPYLPHLTAFAPLPEPAGQSGSA